MVISIRPGYLFGCFNVIRNIVLRAGLCLVFGMAALTGRAAMTLQSLYGPVTATEISSFKAFLAGESPPAGQTYDNSLADGTAGMEAEALGLMYEVTNDPALLNQMIQYADQFLALRNDTNSGRIMWDGVRDPVWLTKPATNSDGTANSQAGYAGCENNDIVGHIAVCAKLILESPPLWNLAVPSGDPHTNGATYYQRAQTYVRQMDLVQDAYMLKWFINPANNQIVAPASPAWTSLGESVNAYNRQMMFLNGFQRLSECHQLLGDNPARVAKYDAIVKAAMNAFIASLQPYSTNGIPVYNWVYSPGGGGSEDNTLHSTYDIWGITRAWASGRYGISNATMAPFANTLQYVMNVSTNHISYYVNGTSSPNSPRNFIYPGWMPIANFGPATFPIMANMDVAQGSQKSTAIFDALILWVKNARFIGYYPTNAATPDFTISTPWIQNIAAGGSVSCPVTVNSLAGFAGSVALSASHLPPGISASFNPASLNNGNGTSTLTLFVSNSVAGGIYALTNAVIVTGTSSIGARLAPVVIAAKSQPAIVNAASTSSGFVFSGTNGFPGATFYVLSSSNSALPLSQWTRLAANVMDTNGNFSATNQFNGSAAEYFILQY